MTDKKMDEKALALVEWKGCTRPIPQFLTTLPWARTDDDAINDIVLRILNAESVEKALEQSDSVKFETLVDTVITIHGFRMMPSDIETGVGAYALIDFTETGSDVHKVTTTSALGVMAQLWKIHQLGGYPVHVGVLEIDTGKNGKNNPLYLALPKTVAFQ